MKAAIIALLLSGISLTLFHSCNKDDNSVDPNSDEKSITEFSIPKMLEEATITEEDRTIEFSVPAMVNLHKVSPTIVVSPGAIVEPPSHQIVNLSQPFKYLVKAPNGSQQEYTVISEQHSDTALLIIDVQNAWALEAFNCDSLFANINLLANRARAANVPVIYVFDNSDQNTSVYSGLELSIVEAIQPMKGDKVIGKMDVLDVLDNTTRVGEALMNEKAGVLVICGMTSGACVNSTCLGALQRGYGVIIASDCHSFNARSDIINPQKGLDELNSSWAAEGAVVLKARDIYF